MEKILIYVAITAVILAGVILFINTTQPQQESSCENYRNVSAREIPARCISYFNSLSVEY